MDKNSLNINNLHFLLPDPSLSRLCAEKMKFSYFFPLDQFYIIAIIKPDAVISRKSQEIRQNVSDISPQYFKLMAT